MAASLAPWRVSAFNTAKQSENKMHDDTVARRFGFSGGLVPGVEVMAYMMHLPVARWGRDFLERGLIEARFVKPVYDGETATVTGEDTGEGLSLTVESRGTVCATGSASLPPQAPAVDLAAYPETAVVTSRPAVGSSSFPVGQWLGTAPVSWGGERLRDYLAEIRETDPIYFGGDLIHPGTLQRIMNRVLVDNVVLGPWIHVGSRMQLLHAVRGDDALNARAKVVANYDKKGHRFAEFDALIVANGTTPVAHCHHIAIVQPRQQAAA
jgi:acyl dehydratase